MPQAQGQRLALGVQPGEAGHGLGGFGRVHRPQVLAVLKVAGHGLVRRCCRMFG